MGAALARSSNSPLRLRLQGEGRREFLVMPALSERFSGVKILAIAPENADRCMPTMGGLFALLDAATGEPLAIMDAGELTARRTAALSALAARKLSRVNAASLLVLGTGHLAPYLAEAYCAVRPIRNITIWGRHAQSAESCCALVRQRTTEIDVSYVGDLETAVRNCDIMSAATRAQHPLIMGKWIAPGQHIDLVGGYRPDMREIDDEGIARASIFVDSLDGALAEAGDLRSPIERGVITTASIKGDISILLDGPGRVSDEEVTLFKSVGSASSDLAAAELVWDSRCG
jgi:ornithine cyclodeaminase